MALTLEEQRRQRDRDRGTGAALGCLAASLFWLTVIAILFAHHFLGRS